MPHLLRRTTLAGAVAAVLLAATNPVSAAGQRSFVSTSGVDNPTCSVAAPCRSFGAAVAATAAGGEVIALDSGGYGPVTITQSVSIIAPPGVYAGISVSSGNGVDILTALDSVTLRGLTINNVGGGSTGINFTSAGHLQVEDVHVTGFSNECLLAAPATDGDLVVERSTFSRCGWGIVLRGAGIAGAAGSLTALIDHVSSHHNVNTGIEAEDRALVVIRNSLATYNTFGVWSVTGGEQPTDVTVEASDLSHNTNGAVAGTYPGTATARLAISRSEITQNGTGILSGDNGSVIIAGTTITRNGTGIAYAGSGVANSQGNNLISGNGTDGTSPTVVGSK